ncbi:hypothetical protein GS399_19930 [Pedobacter sp. HMF7647]|uniref:Uncharacterized protein n=1 Tax=Hufsiella arboris TaxID=2695275 RepID=A0A7K1YF88_9SPHI|nr:hypothetical protein [Hufsiella arboris]MXV53242.1 hypothetical protein [Hufsiella arboris]
MTPIIKKVQAVVKNGWVSLIFGLLFLATGFWVIATPLQNYMALSLLFSAFTFISLIMELSFAIINRDAIRSHLRNSV